MVVLFGGPVLCIADGSRAIILVPRAVSSAVEHYNDTVGVTGSNPVPPTTFLNLECTS